MIRKVITGKLKALTGIHIGSGELTETTDSPVFRNTDNEILIPGTAIAGALRTLATKIVPSKCLTLDGGPQDAFCDCPVCDLFGSIIRGKDSENATASKIWVYDAAMINGSKRSIRDGTGIDRETKTSARIAQAKYDLEVVPKDSEFKLRLELQENILEENEDILAAILSEWAHERCYLGGNLARGLGNMQLKDIEVYALDVSTPEKLINFLKEEDPVNSGSKDGKWLYDHVEKARRKNGDGSDVYCRSFAHIEFTLRFTGGFVINEILNAVRTGYDFCPYMEDGKFVLPGSSLRGVLRSHAEKIARTLATLNCVEINDFPAMCPACNPHADTNAPLSSCNSILCKYRKKDRISPESEVKEEQLCLACRLFGSSYIGSRLYVSDGYLVNHPPIKRMDFLAIDRFTGGGREGAKFDAEVLWKPDFKIRIFLENPKEWELGWLMLLLKDLDDGLLSVGFGQNKWFGNAKIENERIKFGVISDGFVPNGLTMKADNSLEGVFRTAIWNFKEMIAEPDEPMELWIKEFHNALKSFRRGNSLRPFSDTYFDGVIENLYPKEVEL